MLYLDILFVKVIIINKRNFVWNVLLFRSHICQKDDLNLPQLFLV